jgi:hypothetical protein
VTYSRIPIQYGDRDSTLGIATCYGMDVSGIESGWGKFSCPSRPNQPPERWVLGLFLGKSWPERDACHLPFTVAEVANGLELNHRLLLSPAQACHDMTCVYYILQRDVSFSCGTVAQRVIRRPHSRGF